MNGAVNSLTRLILVAIPVGALVSVVTLGLLYAGVPFFGPVNDLVNAAVAIMIGALAWLFLALPEGRPALVVPAMVFAWAGAILIIGNSVRVAFGGMGWQEGGMYTAIGYALIGVWLVLTMAAAGGAGPIPPAFRTSAIVIGLALISGLIAGPVLAERLVIRTRALVWVAYGLTAVGWLSFPLWCLVLSRRL